jgi:hypothetical protein
MLKTKKVGMFIRPKANMLVKPKLRHIGCQGKLHSINLYKLVNWSASQYYYIEKVDNLVPPFPYVTIAYLIYMK